MTPFSLGSGSALRNPRLLRLLLPALLVVVAIALALPSVTMGWQQDDLVHRYFLLGNPDFSGNVPSPLDMFRFMDGDSTRAAGLMDVGVVPWWTHPQLRISFWRPLSALTHWVDYLLWPGSAVLMHLQSLAWFAGVILAAVVLYRRMLGLTWIAGLATLFFALDDAHGLAAGWLANRNALLALFFGILTLLVHDRWRRDDWRPGMLLGPALLVLTLLSGESGLAVCAYLFAYALFIDPGNTRARVVSLVPYAAIAVVWLVAYSLSGYGTNGSGFYVDPLTEPLRFAAAVAWKMPLLLADQLGLPPSSIVLFLPASAIGVMVAWAVVFIAGLMVLLIPLLRRDQLARFWFTGMALSVPLVCSTMPHSRLLMFAGIGAFGLLAQWVGGIVDHAGWVHPGRPWNLAAKGMVWFFVFAHMVVAPLMLPFNATSAAFAQPYIQDATSKVDAGPEFERQDLIILNHPIVFYAHSFQTARIVDGQAAPRRVRVLAPGTTTLAVRRTDGKTLVVRPEGGFLAAAFDDVFRSPAHPFRKGDEVGLTGLTVRIARLTDDGRPAEVEFEFLYPLEDASLRWVPWKEGGYAGFTPPAIGEIVFVQGSPILP